jgi:hypothetical protein
MALLGGRRYMPFHQLSDDARRALCRKSIESLELWLRRFIDDELTKSYGDYVKALNPQGQNVLNNSIRKELTKRHSAEPLRYPRLIDAALLDTEIAIICNPCLYETHFRKALSQAFPEGADEARTFLNRLLPARNALSHANPVTVRQCEQVICYSNDIIDSLKAYYLRQNMSQNFVVPTILCIRDSLGHVAHSASFPNTGHTEVVDFKSKPKTSLRPGDALSIELEMDPAFTPEDYSILWSVQGEEVNPPDPSHIGACQ